MAPKQHFLFVLEAIKEWLKYQNLDMLVCASPKDSCREISILDSLYPVGMQLNPSGHLAVGLPGMKLQ